MQLAEIPENDPLLYEIKHKLSTQDFGAFLYTIRNGYHDMMLKILEDNFNKKQAKYYNEKMMFWIRKKVLGSKIKETISKKYWSKFEIISFLCQKQDVDGENLFNVLQSCTADIRTAILRDMLSKSDFQTVLPHINEYFKKGEYENRYAKQWTEYQLQIFNYIQKNLTNQKAQQVINLLKQQKINQVESILKQNISKKEFQFMWEKIRANFDPNFGSEQGSQLKWQNPQVLSFSKYGQKEMDELFTNDKFKQNNMQNLIYDQLQEKFGFEESKTFKEVQDLLKNGKPKKAISIVKEILSKRDAQYFKKKINEIFSQKIRMPLPTSIFYKKNQTGIELYHLQTQSKLEVSESQMVNVMIVGMTGVGKTTFLNSLVNKIMDVQMEDNFRYFVSKENFQDSNGKSSTQRVNIYSIPKQGRMKKSIRLIDIPGLGDTDGIKKDKQNLQGIFQKIKTEVPFLNLILYVFKASQTRVTKEAQYVMGQIMGMFGKDMGQNIRFILTFADKSTPCVLGPLQSSFPQIINQIKLNTKDWYLKVNNSALFQKIDQQEGKDAQVTMNFYKMGQLCLQKTLEVMQSIAAVSTKQSQDVMKLRKQLEQEIKQFQQYINASLKNQQQIRKLIANVGFEKEAMEKINYKYEVEEEKIVTKETKNIVTTCLTCKFTCHSKCSRSNEDKYKCMKMKQGYCTACPGSCRWTDHINDHLIIKRVFVKVSKTYAELQKKYKTLQSSKTKNQSLIVNLFNEYTISITKVKLLCEMLQKKTMQLANIELKKVNHLTIVDYIDILIAKQNHDKGDEYLKRIEQYESIKSDHKRLWELLDANDEKRFACFAQLMRQRVKQLIPDTKMANQLIQKVNENMKQIQTFQKDIIKARQAQKKQFAKGTPTPFEQLTMCSDGSSVNNGQ